MKIFVCLLCCAFIVLLALGLIIPPGPPASQVGSTSKQADSSKPREVRRFAANEDGVFSLAFSPDGHFIAAGGGDGTVRLWETSSGKEIRRFGPSGLEIFQIKDVGFSIDGQRVFVTGDFDLLFRCWDRQTGRQIINSKEPGEGLLDAIEAAVLPISLLTDEKNYYARAEKAEGLAMVHMALRPWYRSMLAVSNDGRRGVSLTVLVGVDRKTVRRTILRIWDLEKGKELRRFEGKAGLNWDRLLDPLNDKLPGIADWCSTLVAMTISRCDSTLASFIGRSSDAPIDCLAVCHWALSADVRQVLCGSDDAYLRIWDVKTGKLLRRFPQEAYSIQAVAFSPDSRLALSATALELMDGTYKHVLRLWNVETGRLIHTLAGHEKPIQCAAFSRDGRRILSGGEDRTVRLWDVKTGREIHCFRGHVDQVDVVAFSPDGKYALSGGSRGDNKCDPIRLWRLPE